MKTAVGPAGLGSAVMLLVRISSLLVLAAVTAVCAEQAGGFPRLVVADVPDLTIKTRRTLDRPNSTIETEIVNLKGPWQRREEILDFPATIPNAHTQRHVAITRCDERRTLQLNEEARTYSSTSIEDMAVYERRLRLTVRRMPQAVPAGADVKISVDSVDTGERRQFGRHTARHVITTTTTTPSPGANARANQRVEDGCTSMCRRPDVGTGAIRRHCPRPTSCVPAPHPIACMLSGAAPPGAASPSRKSREAPAMPAS